MRQLCVCVCVCVREKLTNTSDVASLTVSVSPHYVSHGERVHFHRNDVEILVEILSSSHPADPLRDLNLRALPLAGRSSTHPCVVHRKRELLSQT